MNTVKILALLSCLLFLCACNTLQKTDNVSTQRSADPLNGFNRQMYAFNNTADQVILKPIATVYSKAVPQPARSGINNFFDNLGEPLNAINNLLQGKFDGALHSTYRFTVNSTIGLLGFFDVADRQGVAERPEDFGQTFAAWGAKPGAYLVLPFMGPSNVRDGLGRLTSGVVYYPNSLVTDTARGALALTAIEALDLRANLLGTDSVLRGQLDPYLFLKVAYENDRIKQLYDGSPPEEPEEDFDF